MRNGNGNDDGVCASGAQREWREEEEEEEEEAGAKQCHELRSVREAEVREEEEGEREGEGDSFGIYSRYIGSNVLKGASVNPQGKILILI